MAHLELTVGLDHHITMFHFEVMSEAKAQLIDDVMHVVMSLITSPPQATFGERAMMGQYKNMPAIMVESPQLQALRKRMAPMFDERGIEFSRNFAFNPHVSRPLASWKPGEPVPLLPWLTLVWKGHRSVDYELR